MIKISHIMVAVLFSFVFMYGLKMVSERSEYNTKQHEVQVEKGTIVMGTSPNGTRVEYQKIRLDDGVICYRPMSDVRLMGCVLSK